ncbi:glycosyltransferase family protein [Candidatus Pacearchaeota archaeon]|nr:glycosyltransferase family protein [Candidatus Pacearchaeota archaeon]
MSQSLTINQAFELALKEHQEGNLEKAKILYEKILEINPDIPDALHLLGVILYQNKEYEKAINKIEHALEFKTSDAGYYINLGQAYDAFGNKEKAVKSFKKSLDVDGSHIKSYVANFYLGLFHKKIGEFNEAIKYYNKAIELNKNLYDAYWNRGLLLLLLGRFEEGWEDYEFRLKMEKSDDKRVFNKPQWGGEVFKNKKLLVVMEQGFGDNIQFVRYLPLVKERGGEIILECKKELLKLFKDFPGVDEIIEPENKSVPNIDFYIHLMSLPRLFHTNIINIPHSTPYLKAEPILVEKVKPLLKTNNLKVGIVWAGNPLHYNDKNRSTTFENFKPLTKIHGISFFSLQKEKFPQQMDDSKLADLSSIMNDFSDTAALIENLDLVISVDTSVAHLAGAMNKPVWTLLPFLPEWRYLLNRPDSPWYPSMRLFRQPKPGDWDSVFIELEKELNGLLKNRNLYRI